MSIAALCCGALAPEPALPPVRPPLVTPDTEQAIRRGLEYLKRTQSRDGSWRTAGPMGRFPVAMTSLAGLALLANGNTTTQGPYAPEVSRAMQFLLNSSTRSGLITRFEEESRSMHGHGFAMLFLGELYGMEPDVERQERVHDVLTKAIALTARSQSRRGGWLYTPDSTGDEGSVTVTQVQGLRACRNAGVTVPKKTIDQAMQYLEDSALQDGGIAYRAGQRGGSRPPITAAAVVCWYNAGQYNNPLAVKALDYCKKRIGVAGGRGQGVMGHYFYAHLYFSQVMWMSGEGDWKAYYPAMRDHLLATQDNDGSWQGDMVGTVYGTSVALVILQLPYQRLPIMQR